MFKYLHVTRELAANAAMGIPAIRRRRILKGRTIGIPVDTKARLVMDQFAFFIDAIGAGNIKGKVVVEIGPGDAIPLAPLFLAAGAARYVAVDRFLGNIYGPRALDLYSAVVNIASAWLIEGLERLYKLDRCDSISELIRMPNRVRLCRTPIERPDESLVAQANYIVSFNVCEHLSHLPRALDGMRSMLSPDGFMIHRVDYGPHDIWQTYRNPLSFLTVPRPLWGLMTSNRGCPNRVRHAELMAMVRALGLKSAERIGRRASSADISEARPHLASEFRYMSDDDISVLDAEVICGYSVPTFYWDSPNTAEL